MNKKDKILFFCMIFVATNVFSQNPQQKTSILMPAKNTSNPLQVTVLSKNTEFVSTMPQPFLSANYYAAHLGFFCKQEIKLEKVSKIPFKFRLGSVEDCDRMEGKKKIN